MVFTKYKDNISYSKNFGYLYNNYNFKPKIINNDKESSLSQAINENENINKELILTRCFIHLGNMIKKNYQKKD